MKIGIIVYSQTGNTLSVCEKMKEKLTADGHSVLIEKIETSGDLQKDSGAIKIKKAPDPSPYDGIIFASPVQAFSLAAPMKIYMKGLKKLEGKTIYNFVTKQLPMKWTGGNHALAQMASACRSAGAALAGKGLVIWSSKKRDADIKTAVQNASDFFKA